VELGSQYGLDVPPDAIVEDLPVGVQQRVEIIKALRRDADVLILDEPTAVLTPQEIDDLFVVLRQLRAAGKSIVFITHKLKEVQQIADTITVIRRGRVVGSAEPGASEAELATLMVGRAVELRVTKTPADPGDVVLDVRDLAVLDERGQRAVDGVSFDVRAGEILAVAGVQGNGQTELVQALTGLRAILAGSVLLRGEDLAGATPRQILDAGVGHVPEDRQADGLVGEFSIAENLILDTYAGEPYASGLALHPSAIGQASTRLMSEFDIRATSIDAAAQTLSGGNQQKVVLARELSRPLRLLIASQPTRGLDVGSIEFVHRRVIEARDGGAAVLIVSSELDEVLALADRIAVMFRGRVVGIVPGGTGRDEIGMMMAGAGGQDEQVAS
jgi:simple sugar transport system ATP-binding protein